MCGKSRILQLSLGRQCRTGRSEPVMAVALSLLNRNAQWRAAAGSCTRGLCAARKWNWFRNHAIAHATGVGCSRRISENPRPSRPVVDCATGALARLGLARAYARDEKRKLPTQMGSASEPAPPTMISSCYGKMPPRHPGPERSQSGIREVAVAGLLRRSLAQFGNYGCCAQGVVTPFSDCSYVCGT